MSKFPRYDSRVGQKEKSEYKNHFPTNIKKDCYDNGKIKSEYFSYNLKIILERDFPNYNNHEYNYYSLSRRWDEKGELESFSIGNPNTFFSTKKGLYHSEDMYFIKSHNFGFERSLEIFSHNYKNIDGFNYPLFSTKIEYYDQNAKHYSGWPIKRIFELRDYKSERHQIGREIIFHSNGNMEKDYLWKMGKQEDRYDRSPDLDELDSRERYSEIESPSGGYVEGEIGPIGAGICIKYDHDGYICQIFNYSL